MAKVSPHLRKSLAAQLIFTFFVKGPVNGPPQSADDEVVLLAKVELLRIYFKSALIIYSIS